MWLTNVVEFSKLTYYFVVPLFGFSVYKHYSKMCTFLLSHLLTKADSLPWNSAIIKIKTRVFGWFKFATSPKRGSNPPPLVAQMPVELLGERNVEASNWSTLKSVLLTRHRRSHIFYWGATPQTLVWNTGLFRVKSRIAFSDCRFRISQILSDRNLPTAITDNLQKHLLQKQAFPPASTPCGIDGTMKRGFYLVK